MRPIGRAAPTAGFTLIELLIALTLVGLISVVLFGGLRFGTRAWEAGGKRAAALTEVEAVQGLLRRQLVQAALPVPGPSEEEALIPFQGAQDRLRFVAPAPAALGVGGPYVFELLAEPDDTSVRLTLAWWMPRAEPPAPDDEEVTALAGRRVLLEGLEALEFAYFGTEGDVTEPDWLEGWDGSLGLPVLVAVLARFPSGDARSWPDLVVAPRLSQGAAVP